jgi:hypothetical protein
VKEYSMGKGSRSLGVVAYPPRQLCRGNSSLCSFSGKFFQSFDEF